VLRHIMTACGGMFDAVRRLKGLPALTDLALASLGTWILVLFVPWQHVLSSAIPTGGDNPAHPVLMQSVGDALFSHGSIVHYSYAFWNGFEAFQFYFPLPYVCGAALARVVHPNVAFKLMTLCGLLGLPVGFYYMAKGFGLSKITCAVASLLSLSFLFTDAHVMWGGNVNSALAGMIANSWAFVFVALAFGKIVQAWDEGRFLVSGVVFTVLAMLSHFYATLMLLLLYVALALLDALRPGALVASFRRKMSVYAIGAVSVMLMAWWIVPLVAYRTYSAEFGANWDVDFLGTFRLEEKIAFVASIVAVVGQVVLDPRRRRVPVAILLFGALGVVLYFWGYAFFSTAFLNIRIWPTVYLFVYLTIILAVEVAYRRATLPVFALLVALLWFLVPADASTGKAREWMLWNYTGVEGKRGAAEFGRLIAALSAEPPGRVSFESYARNNDLIGSVRTFELIPYLTHHEIVEGGIVNSSSFAGVSYFLQCLASESCAGWPHGSIMPARDIPRAIDMMRALGVRYHIAATAESRRAFDESPDVVPLVRGSWWTLYKMIEDPSLVEVYDGPPLVVPDENPLTTLVNLPRWDLFRNAAVIFDRTGQQPARERAVWNRAFFDRLADEWRTDGRVADLGWADRKAERTKYLNSFVLSRRDEVQWERDLGGDPEFFIADRGWDPDLMSTSPVPPYPALLLPLAGSPGAEISLGVHGKGFRAVADGTDLALNGTSNVSLGSEDGRAVIRFYESRDEAYPYLDVTGNGGAARPSAAGRASVAPPARITDRCAVSLDRAFHRLALRTGCPGKPHLIKYRYYPKWGSTVPVHLATNGFMLVVPEGAETVLEHRRGRPDHLGIWISLVGFGILLWARRALG
jgi:hypothetical protein